MSKKPVYPSVDIELYNRFKLLAKELNVPVNYLFEEAMILLINVKTGEDLYKKNNSK